MKLTALLIAGGDSRRMGRDKATIIFRGKPLWERQLGLLRELRPQKVVISARTEPAWLPDDAELLLDDPPSRGPLSGLSKALAALRTTHLLVLAVDMSFMTAEELASLCELATEGRGVVPVIGERAEPLAAIYPAEATLDFQAALMGLDSSLQSVVRKLALVGKVMLWPVRDARANLYQSLNEPGDIKEGRFLNRPPS